MNCGCIGKCPGPRYTKLPALKRCSSTTTDLNLAFSRENLERAWLWTLTNREAHYKSYFRQIYRAYSLSQDKHLEMLWENVDLRGATLLIPDPKNREPHMPPLTDFLLAVLKHRWTNRQNEYVFLGNGEKFRYLRDVRRHLWSVFQISAESMVEVSSRLFKFVDDNIGDCAWYRECPITWRVEHQRVHGVIDLLLETQDALFIIDHKSFPGASDKWG